ncbi:zinc finger ZZ-type and EF-hand domain-containing protein 1 isoform X2 [Nematostella vectensis]|uniref:zinc finger ZZ-type and EF-hand domain-containing protein 1 isoform X2 n=1 Tax=Nematostella vectensis TaxID=45351 RepID=UPI0020772802|nr:zinc finger ZZ-type and EF-hand domain-containing protein 1 isoform X2 [Nematostella vectensis]
MGNAPSGAVNDSEDDDAEFYEEGQSPSSDKDSTEGSLDLGALFDHTLLREAAGKIKEEAHESFLQQHLSTIVRWLQERRDRHDESIRVSQFTDMLVNRGANRDDCFELFSQFDAEGEGNISVEYFLETLQSLPGGCLSSKGDLRTSIKTFHSCSITPGFVDAYADNSEALVNHGQKLLKFIKRNRAQSSTLPLPALDGFSNTTEMRLKVLQAHIDAIKEKADIRKRAPPVEEGEVLKPLAKCYTDIEVSTNKTDASRVINGESGSYWQSDGPARSHWVRLRMRPNVVLKLLSINVASADQSYMPQHVVVMAGRDETHLREIADVRIPSHITGDYTLVENVKVPYLVFQINIKRCHSDGCDTRIRGLKAVGYKVLKSKGMSVGDASGVWYLSVLGATTQATLPLAPHLRDTIISLTKQALTHMHPLCLSPTSPERPTFLTQNVMEEIENFLHNVVSFGGKTDPDSLRMLIDFTLARGSLKSILRVLRLLYDLVSEEFEAVDLIQGLQEVQFSATRTHGSQLKMSLVSCDGGEKDKTTKAENVLSENWTEAYISESGKASVNMLFISASSNPVRLTRLIIRVSRGAIGPRGGLVFVVDEDPSSDKEKDKNGFEHLDKYNDWTKAIYTDHMKKCLGHERASDDPIAFFNTEDDWDEVEVGIDSVVTGKYIVIKFLGPRGEQVGRIGVLGVHFFGYEISRSCPLSQDLGMEQIAPVPESNPVQGATLFLRILAFLDDMAKDQSLSRSKGKESFMAREKEGQLDLSTTSLELIWDVYTRVTSRGRNRKTIAAGVLLLRLLYQSLPYLKASKLLYGKEYKQDTDKKQQLSQQVFAHLCEIVDNEKDEYGSETKQISQHIILEGAEVFFPDTKTRRDHLLTMVDQVMKDGTSVSLAITFASLCRFFSSKDASGLLGLPASLPEDGCDCSSVIGVMTTLLSVAQQEVNSSLAACKNSTANHGQDQSQANLAFKDSLSSSNLVQLLCAMQKNLIIWCHNQLKTAGPRGKEAILSLIQCYTDILSVKVCSTLQIIHALGDKKMAAIDRLEQSFIASATRQLVLFLSLFVNEENICMPILRSLQPIALELRRFSTELPDLFFKIDSEEWNKAQGQTVLRTWDVESNHEYENNQDLSMVFSCPGCSEFTVEFDPRCETERKYDYLEFTDSSGNKRRFDQKVGTDKWPLTLQFKAGNRLLFYFHSDGSNSEWGYKFKVTAKGSPDVALSWIFDLQLGIAILFGSMCSAALDSRKASLPPSTKEGEEDDSKLLHSEIWTTLFRGGYMTEKLQRSLSGHHSTSPPQQSTVNSYLQMLIDREDASTDDLIKRCRAHHSGPFMGGPAVDKAVVAVFAALIWHSQELRDQVVLFASHTPPESLPEGIMEAFTVAESLRRNIIERRQKLILQAESENEESGIDSKINPDSPVINCREKAQFLLKFAGLQRITEKSEGRDSRRSKWLNRKTSWQKSSSNENLTENLVTTPRQRTISFEDLKTIDKHPAFRRIIDFVTNDSFSHERIRALLQQRIKHANTVADVYLFAAEFLKISSESDVVQAPAVLFLQEFLFSQKHFPSHYCDNLDGCGLSLESKVRRAYYTLVRRGLDAVKSYCTSNQRSTSAAFECLRAFVLHLLDTEWKAYDHTFILDVRLPEFLLETSKATVVLPKLDMNDLSEQQELDHYDDSMRWYEEAKTNFDSWWHRMEETDMTSEQKRRMHLFVAQFSDTLDVVITCDGCDCRLPGRRYRCLVCPDVDLCSACYLGGVKPEGHLEFHQVIDLRFKCDECNSFIVGTRFHCNECEDFDLCIGCHTFGKFPSKHIASHRVTKYPLKTDTIANQPSGLVQMYTHHHAWLQFAALTLSLANTLNTPVQSGLNIEYLRTAGLLHMECLDLVTRCLQYAIVQPDEDEPKSSIKSDTSKEKVTEGKLEEKLKEPPTTEVQDHPPSGPHNLPDRVTSPVSALLEAVRSEASSSESLGASAGAAAAPEAAASGITEPNPKTVVELREVLEGMVPPEKVESALSASLSLTDSEPSTGGSTVLAEIKVSDASMDCSANEAKTCGGEEKAKPYSKEKLEKLFARGAQDRLLGLLGAVLPTDSKLSRWSKSCVGIEEFISTKFLPALYSIIRSKCCEGETRSLAMGLLGKFLQCTNPEVSDRAIGPFISSGEVTEDKKTEEECLGRKTVGFLFSLGAEYLAKSDLNASSGMASTLQLLASASHWEPSVAEHIGKFIKCLGDTSQPIELNAIFGLLVFAGFPNVMRMGSVVTVKEAGGESRKAVVVKFYTDKDAVMVIDIRTRHRKTVKVHQTESSSGWSHGCHSTNISVLMDIVKDILAEIKDGTNVSVERLWIVYLALKGLLRSLKSSDASFRRDIISRGVVPLLVNLACQGTSFSSQWLLRDLEVLSLKLYKLEKMQAKAKPTSSTDEPKKDSAPKVPAHSGKTAASECGGQDPYEGLDDVTKACFDTINEAVQAPLSVLRAVYENVGQDRGKLLEEIQRNFDGTEFRVSDEVKEMSKKWEPKPEPPAETPKQDVVIDMGVVRYAPSEIRPQVVEAKPEAEDVNQKLIPIMSEAEIAESREKQARTKSAELLKKELEADRKPGSAFLCKVNKALAIIYARHVLASLLSDWPEGKVIDAEMLDNSDEIQLIGLIDILQRVEPKEKFEKVVSNTVRCGEPSLIRPLSLAASHCMGEETLASETRESEHNYKDNAKDEGKVHIQGAASLYVKFDPRCCTEEGCDELVIATSPDFQQNRYVLDGPQGRWFDIELPGDVLHYRFTSDSNTNDWGWKFVVTGGQLGRFKTGFSVLNALLSLDNNIARFLPLQKLWSLLVSVACCQTGQQRLMATGLLLRLLLVVSGQAVDSDGVRAEALDAPERPDLSLLKPLWALYTKMLEKESSAGAAPTLVPPVLRGLTELFLVVENLAQDWGMAEDLVVGFTTNESLKRCFAHAVQKVGCIGIAIGLPNKASEALIQAAKNPPPEPPADKKDAKKQETTSPRPEYETIAIHITDEENDDTTSDEDDDDVDDDYSDEEFYDPNGAQFA